MNIENTYFGEKLGWLPIIQLGYESFHLACLSNSISSSQKSNTANNVNNSEIKPSNTETDSTGKRLYSGAHVGIRFLTKHSHIVHYKSVCELGCGVGAFGLVSNIIGCMSTLILTDAEESTLRICRENILQLRHARPLCSQKNDLTIGSSNIYCELLSWSDPKEVFDSLLSQANNGDVVDIAIGCELMYYRTDIQALVAAVLQLVDPENGLFVHSHLFRRYGQAEELIHHLSLHDWITYEAPHRSFISERELAEHPEWYRVRQLVSGPRLGAVLQQWKLENSDWVEFSADTAVGNEVDDNDCGEVGNSVINPEEASGQVDRGYEEDGFGFHSLFRRNVTRS
eukprot:gene26778-35100_t